MQWRRRSDKGKEHSIILIMPLPQQSKEMILILLDTELFSATEGHFLHQQYLREYSSQIHLLQRKILPCFELKAKSSKDLKVLVVNNVLRETGLKKEKEKQF